MESYLKDNEKLISRLTLHNNLLAIFKLDCLECISNRQPFPFIQRLCSQDVRMSSVSTSQYLPPALLSCSTLPQKANAFFLFFTQFTMKISLQIYIT